MLLALINPLRRQRNGDAMFEQIIDGVRKASESSLQMQQEMFRHFTRMWGSLAPAGAGIPSDWGRGSQKRWLELGLEMLNKHREALDATYKSGIQLIEQAFHATEAKSSEEYRQTAEDLWRKLVDLQKEQAESQFRDLRGWYEKATALVQDSAKA
jgi:hypothetical protein